MKSRTTIILAIALLSLAGIVPVANATPAFPGAVGFGKDTTGGRADPADRIPPTIYVVTRLDDYALGDNAIPGTFRHALEASGKRIVVFKTGGVIALKRKITVTNPYLTILGQTAPGDGIAVRNHPIRFASDEVIMRGVRVRPGDIVNVGTPPIPDQLDGIQLSTKTHQSTNLIFDHCSFGWTKDEIVELYFGGKNVTLSNCTFAEALWNTDNVDPGDASHGYGPLLDGGFNRSDFITFYQCLFAHNQRRNPWIKAGGTCELINNVLYNWDTEGMGVWRGSGAAEANYVNFIGNYYKPGPHTNTGHKGIIIKSNYTGTQIYFSGNIGPGRPDNTYSERAAATIQQASGFIVDSPVPAANSGIANIKDAFAAFDYVLDHVGALPRDAHDARVVANTRNGDGTYIDSIAEISGPMSEGYPIYDPGTYPADSDGDGMSDSWESENGLNPNDASDATQTNSEGYHWIEVYANSLIDTPTASTAYLDTWPLGEDGWANTENWLGWLWLQHAPWAYSDKIKRYLFVAEDSVTSSGGWVYFPVVSR